MKTRQLNPLDRLLAVTDEALRTTMAGKPPSLRQNPSADIAEPDLDDAQRRHSAGLMRVNHAGEIAAQALYQGQALTAKLDGTRLAMENAASEENDHLAWCAERVEELGYDTSRLAPLWYAGSFAIGAIAGLAGDRWSLGFVAETERQVADHLQTHLEMLPEADSKSRQIVAQMHEDETRHGATARAAGGSPLPGPVRAMMSLTAKFMTKTAYWV